MGISSALYSGVSGLNTNSQAMSVIGNNLANTNTLGFKGSRSVFSDLLSGSINGSGGISQVGRGVGMSTVDQVFSQGTFESTESGLDVAIEGEGFFILKEPDNNTEFYSRAGAFRFDDDGYLVNPEGFRAQGKLYDEDGNLAPGEPTDMQVINAGLVKGQATSTLDFNTNLDSTTELPTVAPFAADDPDSYNLASAVTVYDTLGNPQILNVYFIKTAANTWSTAWSAVTDDGNDTALGGIFADNLAFNADGILPNAALDPPLPTTITIDAADIDWANGTTPTEIVVTLDTTQFNNQSKVLSREQNGYAAGSLTGVDIDEDGILTASYSNGEEGKIGQFALAKFFNPNGLELAGSNTYIATLDSGAPRIGLPGPELGKVFTNSLEQSNVDMGAEFVRMITVQRGFQANSKIITTVDELLGELINLKR